MRKYSTPWRVLTSEERQSTIETEVRVKTRDWIEVIINEELDAAFGITFYGREENRLGYRKGRRARTFTTSNGKHQIMMPRGAYFKPGIDGKKEWNSQIIRPYARRSEEVEDALIKSYLCGASTRRIKHALGPLLKDAALSKSAVSRITARLSDMFDSWRKRDLSEEDIALLFLDGFNLNIRLGGKVEKVPIMAAIGVRADGTRVLLVLEMRTSESNAAWLSVTEGLAARGVKSPVLAAIDGNQGLENAVKTTWPWIDIQRCTKHKLDNLYSHGPKRRQDELKQDYHAIVYAQNEAVARRAYKRFEKKWETDCPGVVRSLREGGDDLLTFFRYPKSTWKMLRTTNGIERMNGEFRRRVKTQGSLPNTEAGLKLLYGLFAAGLIALRRIDGWRDLGVAVHSRRIRHGLIKAFDNVA